MHKDDLVLNNLKCLICYKIQPKINFSIDCKDLFL